MVQETQSQAVRQLLFSPLAAHANVGGLSPMHRIQKRSLLILVIITSNLLFAIVPQAYGQENTLESALDTARNDVYPALVNIAVVGQNYQGGREQKFPAAGSGVIVTSDGYVLTNYHVAGETTRITCTLPSGREFDANVIVHDPLTDLSVLKIEDPENNLPCAPLGNSDALQVGDYVLAMGNPNANSNSMTLGIVSHPKRVFTSFTGNAIDEQDLGGGQTTGLFTRWIQHDALILPGNSGGPLVNLKGEIIGINELGGQGVGFAIPSNLAGHVLKQAIDHGEVRRGWIGASIRPVDELGRDDGALVTWVVPAGPADVSGIKAGDVLLEVDGEAISAKNFEAIPPILKMLADLPAGKDATLVVMRGGERRTCSVPVAPMEAYLGDQAEIKPLGITVRDITRQMSLARRWPNRDGVLITGARAGKPADKARPAIKSGDVILSINGVPVNNHQDLQTQAGMIEPEAPVLVELRRGQEHVITVVEINRERESQSGGALPVAWLGVKTQVMTSPVAEALGLQGQTGFRITRVLPNTEAADAGLKTGDVITHMNDRIIKARRIQDAPLLERMIENQTIGDTVSLTLNRNSETIQIPVVMEQIPTGSREAAKSGDGILEFDVRDLTPMDLIEKRWPSDLKGVLITDVENGGWGSLAGLSGQDVVISIQGNKTPDVNAFDKAMKDIHSNQPEVIEVFIQRGHRTTFLFIEPVWMTDKKVKPAPSDT